MPPLSEALVSTYTIYEGDGQQRSFSFSFPYLSPSHVKVFINGGLVLETLDYSLNGNTITFDIAPQSGSTVEIKRQTALTERLVDFTDGSTLSANDLDTAYLHNLYLAQEYQDSYNKLIQDSMIALAGDNGIVPSEPDAVIGELVARLLEDEAAQLLQQALADINLNAESIASVGESLQTQINTLAQGTAATVFVQPNEPTAGVGGVPDPIPDSARWYDSDNNNKPHIYDQNAASWISIDDPRIGANEADITALDVRLTSAESGITANADAFNVLDTTVTNLNGTLSALSSDVTNLQASLTTAESDIVANASSVSALSSRVTQTETDIASNALSITNLQTSLGDAESDISANATAISSLNSQVSSNDTDITAINSSITALNASITGLNSDTSANASSISALSSRVTSTESSISSQSSSITSLNSSVSSLDGRLDTAELNITAVTSAVNTAGSDINSLEAMYGVRLNVNGYVTGFIQNNNGSSGNFVILADRFAVVDPSGDANEAEYVPFEISNGKINLRGDVQIDGDLLLNGTLNGNKIINGTIVSGLLANSAVTADKISANAVTAAKISANAITADKVNVSSLSSLSANLGTITAGNLTLNSAGFIRGGATGYMSGTGFWMGYSSGYKFHIGNPSTGNYMAWDGTNLTVKGDLFVGEYAASEDVLASAGTARSSTSSSYTDLKKFTVDRSGSVRLKFNVKRNVGFATTINTYPRYRILKNGSEVTNAAVTSTSYTTISTDISVTADDVITVQGRNGSGTDTESLPVSISLTVQNATINGTITFGGGVAVTQN